MRVRTRSRVLWLAIILLVSLCVPQKVRAADLYFTAVNDSLLPLTGDSMPLWSSAMLYVPYTVFDEYTTGLNLGVNVSYNREKGQAAIYNTKKILTYDLNRGTCWDDVSGIQYSGQAILRNGKPYVPLRTVCSVFGLSYSQHYVKEGYLIRIKNDAAVLSDTQFIDAAGNLIQRRWKEYQQSQEELSATNPSPTPTPPQLEESESVEEEPVKQVNVDTYLAFECQGLTGLDTILSILAEENCYGIFFFPPDLLRTQGEQVRKLLGLGHRVGLLAKGETMPEVKEQLTQGRQAFQEQTYGQTHMVLTDHTWRSALEEEGWVCWMETLELSPNDHVGQNYYAGAVLRRLAGRTKRTYLTVELGENSARVLDAVLQQLRQAHYLVKLPLEVYL